MTYPWIQFFLLCLFWALHAYIIHPYMVMREYRKRSQQREWVKVILKVPHELLMDKLEGKSVGYEKQLNGLVEGFEGFDEGIKRIVKGSTEEIGGLFTGFAEDMGHFMEESFQNHLKGVQGAVLGPLSQQAKRIEGQIQEQVDQATEQYVAPGVSLPGMEKSLDRLYKRYPLFHDVMAAKQLSEQLIPQMRGQKGGGNASRNDGGNDF